MSASRQFGLLVVTLIAQLAVWNAAQAATLVVDRIDDDPDQITCSNQPIDCSLRGAVSFAELNPGADVIILPTDTITLSTPGDLHISTDVTILGTGMTDSIVTSGVSFDDSAFFVQAGGALTLEDLSLTDFGHIPSANGGGGILIDEDVSATATLHRVRLAGNRAVVGGAIHIGSIGDPGEPVRLRIYDSVIEDNFIDGTAVATSGCLGGGLFITAPTIIERTSILRNAADNAQGGGICVNGTSLTITDSTIANNEVSINRSGAGIYADQSNVTITGSTIDDNDIVGGSGGGIYARGGSLDVQGSLISNNVARISGVQLLDDIEADFIDTMLVNNGSYQLVAMDSILSFTNTDIVGSSRGLTIAQSDFTANHFTMTGHSAPVGGGLRASDSIVRLTDCAFSSNRAVQTSGFSGIGGAIYLADSALQMRRCTLNDNESVGGGGAIFMTGPIFGSIWNSTFSNNQSDSAEAILVTNSQQNITLQHVTMAASNGNSQIELVNSSASFANSAIGGFCNLNLGGGTPTSLGGNVVGDINCFLDGPGDLVVDDLGVSTLSNFGGPTQVHLPLPGSPLLDIASDNCLPTDQRGELRNGPCDAGAVELQPSDDNLFADGFEASS